MKALIISARPEFWQDLMPVMRKRGFTAKLLASLTEACASMRNMPVRLLIFDLPYNFESLCSAVDAVLTVDNAVKIAVVHNLPDSDLKELGPGSGGLLASLPVHPGADDITVLLNSFSA
jgi:hypothetical protein